MKMFYTGTLKMSQLVYTSKGRQVGGLQARGSTGAGLTSSPPRRPSPAASKQATRP